MWHIVKMEPEENLYGIEIDGIIICRFPEICLDRVNALIKAANSSNKSEVE